MGGIQGLASISSRGVTQRSLASIFSSRDFLRHCRNTGLPQIREAFVKPREQQMHAPLRR